jgi:transposase
MSQREVRRAAVLSRVVEGELKLFEAAVVLNMSYRHAKRLYKRFRASGAAGLVHGNAGRRSNRARAVVEQERVLELVRKFYSGPEEKRFGPTLAAEHLLAEHGIGVSPETLRRWMLVRELWSRVRRRRPYRKYRERKAHFGELLQIDGSLHDWFEGRRAPAWLVTLVDDATGTTLARYSEGETTCAAVEVL